MDYQPSAQSPGVFYGKAILNAKLPASDTGRILLDNCVCLCFLKISSQSTYSTYLITIFPYLVFFIVIDVDVLLAVGNMFINNNDNSICYTCLINISYTIDN